MVRTQNSPEEKKKRLGCGGQQSECYRHFVEFDAIGMGGITDLHGTARAAEHSLHPVNNGALMFIAKNNFTDNTFHPLPSPPPFEVKEVGTAGGGGGGGETTTSAGDGMTVKDL